MDNRLELENVNYVWIYLALSSTDLDEFAIFSPNFGFQFVIIFHPQAVFLPVFVDFWRQMNCASSDSVFLWFCLQYRKCPGHKVSQFYPVRLTGPDSVAVFLVKFGEIILKYLNGLMKYSNDDQTGIHPR